MSRPIVAQHLFNFASVISGWNKISVLAGPTHDLIILTLKQEPDYRTRDGLSSKSFVKKPNDFHIYHFIHNEWAVFDLQQTQQNLHYAQPLPQNQWLLARARSGGNTDGNGHIYSAQGTLLRTIPLGDGILNIQTTMQGQLWVAYVDEGVFGDTSFGNAGLACFDRDGSLVFDFNRLNQAMIADCYALNVVNDDEVWLCPYTDFPIVKLKDKQVSHQWNNNPVCGSPAFAVWKDRVLFQGGYSEKDKLFIVSLYRLAGNELLKEECHAVDEEGNEVKFHNAFGRGSRLYLETDQSVYVVELQGT